MKKLNKVILSLLFATGIGSTLALNCAGVANNTPVIAYAVDEDTSVDTDSTEAVEEETMDFNTWYEMNKDTIQLIATSVATIVSSVAGMVIALRRLLNTIKKTQESTSELSIISKSSNARIEECIVRNEEVIAECKNVQEASIDVTRKTLEQQKQIDTLVRALRVAYCNDPNMQKDGRAQSIEAILDGDSEVVSNGEETTN